jgi:predicted flavoprotein YhiN
MASLKPDRIRICFFDRVPDRNAFISHADRTLIGVLNGYVNDRLAEYMVESYGLKRSTCCSDLSIKQIDAFVGHIAEIEFHVTGTEGFDKAQAATGGISLDMIEPSSFAVKGRKGLYAVGELLDIDGKCGGYNLTFAILSGLKAGGGYHA